MKNIVATIDSKTRQVKLNRQVLGVVGENLQDNLIVEFCAEFIVGICTLMIQAPKSKPTYVIMDQDKARGIYTLPVRSNLLQVAGVVSFQVRITENAEDDQPIFKSDIFSLVVLDSINAESEAPDGYQNWFDSANEILAEYKTIVGSNMDFAFVGDYDPSEESLTISVKKLNY